MSLRAIAGRPTVEGWRLFTPFIAVILLIVAALGMGFGLWAVLKATSMPTADGRAMGLLGALTVGGLPFIAGRWRWLALAS